MPNFQINFRRYSDNLKGGISTIIESCAQWHRADLYRVVKSEGPYVASKKYLSYMVEGIREHKIDPVYSKRFIDLYDSVPETSERS